MNWHNPTRVFLWASATLALACGGDMPGPSEQAVLPATNLILDDVTNFGDGRDLELRFTAPADETTVAEYRVFIVKAANAAAFTTSAAASVPAGRSTTVGTGVAERVVGLAADARDTDGDAIVEGSTYVAFVLSVSASSTAQGDTLSAVSNELPLATTTVKVTYLNNAGVMIAAADGAVIIDGLSGNLDGWIKMADADFARLTQASAPFSGVDIVLATHSHGDHFSPSAVNAFLFSNPQSIYVGPPQARSGISNPARIADATPDRGTRVDATINGIAVSVLHVRHFDQFGNNFSAVENYGYIVELGGLRLLHLGDVAYSETDLAVFALDQETIDVVILPTFNTLLSAQNAALVEAVIAPSHVIATHFQGSQLSAEANQAQSLFGNVTAFVRPLQFVRF